jgi:hypothetical protein
LLVGCEPSQVFLPEPATTPEPRAIGSQFNAAESGTINVRVMWEGAKPVISPVETTKRDTLIHPNAMAVNDDMSIRNALVMLRGVDPAKSKPWLHEPVSVELHARGITVHQGSRAGRYGFIRTGDRVTFKTKGDAVHGVRARGADFFTHILPPKKNEVERVMSREGRVELASASGQFWACAELIVSDHPYLALTDEHGNANFDNVPAGKYEIVAWHPNWEIASSEVDPETAMLVRQTYKAPFEDSISITLSPHETLEWSARFSAGIPPELR